MLFDGQFLAQWLVGTALKAFDAKTVVKGAVTVVRSGLTAVEHWAATTATPVDDVLVAGVKTAVDKLAEALGVE